MKSRKVISPAYKAQKYNSKKLQTDIVTESQKPFGFTKQRGLNGLDLDLQYRANSALEYRALDMPEETYNHFIADISFYTHCGQTLW